MFIFIVQTGFKHKPWVQSVLKCSRIVDKQSFDAEYFVR